MLLDRDGNRTLPKIGDEIEIDFSNGSVAVSLLRDGEPLKNQLGEGFQSLLIDPNETTVRIALRKIFSIFSLGIEPIETDSDTKFRYKIVQEDPQ